MAYYGDPTPTPSPTTTATILATDWIDFWTWVVSPIESFLRGAWAFGGELWGQLLQAIDTGLRSFFNFGSFIWDYIANIIWGAMKQFFTSTGEFFTNVGAVIIKAIAETAGTVWNNLVNIGNDIWNTISNLATDVSTLLNNGFSALYNFANDTWNSVLKSLGEIEYFVVTEFKFWVGEAAEYIINALSGAAQGLGQLQGQFVGYFQQLSSDITSGFGGLSYDITTGFNQFSNDVSASFVSFQDAVFDGLGDIWKGFIDNVAVPIGAIVRTGIDAIGDNFIGLIEGGGSLFAQIGATMQGAWDALIKWITGLVNPNKNEIFGDPIAFITKTVGSVLGIFGGFGVALTAAEIAHPIKNMGFTRLAAYINEAGDFKNLAGGLISALQNKATIIPLEQALNLIFRPYLPNIQEANTWRFKGIINEEGWHQIYATRGWSDDLIEKYTKDMWTEPSDRMLIALAETPGVPDEWVSRKIKNRGYDPVDEELFRTYLTKRRLSDEFGRLISAYRAAFIKGYVDYEQFGAIIKATGRSELEYAWMLESANREAETKRLDEDITEYIQAFRTDKLDLDQFSAGIYALPLVPERAKNVIDLELARKRTRTVTGNAAKQAKLSVPQIMKGFDFGWFNDDDVVTRLQLLDYNLEDSMLILAIHKGDIAAREADTTQAAQLAAERKAVAEETRLAIEWARFLLDAISYRQLSAHDVKGMIQDLPLGDARKELFYQEADLIASRPAQEGTAAKPKTLRETDVYKALFNNLITYNDALDYLMNKGYTQEQATLLLQLNAPDYLP